MSTVVFGPYMGELGHEVRTWAPYCQALMQTMPEGTKFYAISWPGRGVLYPGCSFFGWQPPQGVPEWMTLQHNRQFNWDWIKDRFPYDQIYMPNPGGKAALAAYPKAKFMGVGVTPWKPKPIERITVFARNRKDLGTNRNYPHWDRVVQLLHNRWPTAALVAAGTTQGNWKPAGTMDLRWPFEDPQSLEGAAKAIARSDLVIGESSGPMHFALSICGRPISVLCKPGIAARYEGPDNWWGVPVFTKTAKHFNWVDPTAWVESIKLPPTPESATLGAEDTHG